MAERSDVNSIKNPIQTWRYFVTVPERGAYAVVFIDSSGLFLAYSEYGVYGYRWTSIGEGNHIRKFILGICDPEDSYCLRKLSPHPILDGKATQRAIRDHIKERRREGKLSAEEARHEWDILREFDDKVELHDWALQTKLDPWENDFYRSRHDPQAAAFCQHILPELGKQIAAQLEEEKRVRDLDAAQDAALFTNNVDPWGPKAP